GRFRFSLTLGIPRPPPGAPAFVIYVPVVVVVGTFSLTNRRHHRRSEPRTRSIPRPLAPCPPASISPSPAPHIQHPAAPRSGDGRRPAARQAHRRISPPLPPNLQAASQHPYFLHALRRRCLRCAA